MKKLSILGSTGSIGTSALSLVDLYPDRFQVVALAARENTDALGRQIRKYEPRLVALHEPKAARQLRQTFPKIKVLSGMDGVVEAATHPEAALVLSAVTGAAGLVPTYRALLAGKDVALANKETLVMAGQLITDLLVTCPGTLLPVDSEHSALHQCLASTDRKDIRRLVLTASGGPFLAWSKEALRQVSVEQALNHPTWEMGRKITVDSATLMNKGLEVIEAHHLFGVAADQISVIIHPQSTIHSMVEFIDGTILAQLSITDMRSAILYAFSYPERWNSHLPRLDLSSLPALEFSMPDTDKFPCLRLAYQALRAGDTYPAALNAANEVAVSSFLEGSLPFSAIPEAIEEVLNRHQPRPVKSLETVLEADRQARTLTREAIRSLAVG